MDKQESRINDKLKQFIIPIQHIIWNKMKLKGISYFLKKIKSLKIVLTEWAQIEYNVIVCMQTFMFL